jgi:sugar phosphate isomerase/epimerase
VFKLSFMVGPRPRDFRSQEDFHEAIRHGLSAGYAGVEFNLSMPLGFDPGRLAEFSAGIGCPIANVMTGNNGIDDNLWFCVADAAVRRAAVQRIRDLIPIARTLKTTMVIGTMMGKSSFEPDRTAGRRRVLECLREIAETAERHSQTIVLEPMCHMDNAYLNTLDDAWQIIREVGSSCYRPMLDTIHMNIEEKDLLGTFRRAGKDLHHVHLCETNARPAGEGHLDYRGVFSVLKEIGYGRWVTVKAYRDPDPVGYENSMRYLKSIGVA